jgi:hypothetical protein
VNVATGVAYSASIGGGKRISERRLATMFGKTSRYGYPPDAEPTATELVLRRMLRLTFPGRRGAATASDRSCGYRASQPASGPADRPATLRGLAAIGRGTRPPRQPASGVTDDHRAQTPCTERLVPSLQWLRPGLRAGMQV